MLIETIGNGDLFACHCEVSETEIQAGILVCDVDEVDSEQMLHAPGGGSFWVQIPDRLGNPAYDVTLKRINAVKTAL
jgi:hypothetical protein